VTLVIVNVWQYVDVGISMLTAISIPLVGVLFAACCLMSRRQACRAKLEKER
jgi:hypothetical protein